LPDLRSKRSAHVENALAIRRKHADWDTAKREATATHPILLGRAAATWVTTSHQSENTLDLPPARVSSWEDAPAGGEERGHGWVGFRYSRTTLGATCRSRTPIVHQVRPPAPFKGNDRPHGERGEQTLKQACSRLPGSAICVQNFDDSL